MSMTKKLKSSRRTTLVTDATEERSHDQNHDIKRIRTSMLELTDYELIHVRDLFSILLPQIGDHTVSQVLAINENRALVECKLWMKIKTACEAANIPVGESAPDYVIVPTAAPPMGVFQLAEASGVSDGESSKNDCDATDADKDIFTTKS